MGLYGYSHFSDTNDRREVGKLIYRANGGKGAAIGMGWWVGGRQLSVESW
jgi:hypothetical protein